MRFFARFVGATPRIANRSDAFGNSAQMPQILKAFGATYVTEIYYNPYDDDVWVGLDKSAVCVKRLPHPGNGGGWVKYPPCGACKGYGKVAGATCALCDGRGIDLQIGRQKWSPVHLSRRYDHGGVMRVGGEELLPAEETL